MADPILTGGTSTGATPNNVLLYMENDLFNFSTNVLHQGINRRKSANYNQTPIIGAQNSVMTFANSTPMEISVSMILAPMSQDELDQIIDLMDALMASVCPIKNGIEPPSIIYLTIGGNSAITSKPFPTLLASVDQTFPVNRIYSKEGDPLDVAVNLSFIEVSLKSTDAENWMRSKGGKFELLR